ncbi:PaaI family thioesterase [Pandoraea pnomenusa]|uniref:PaaI family thioesterase n=1 Tax=Pandoraea pnomenusa TaxID=93220 RepID=UPI003340653C
MSVPGHLSLAQARHVAEPTDIPAGFVPVAPERFMETVGPVYAAPKPPGAPPDVAARVIGCLAMPQHGNRFGGVHGGMLATLADYAIGINILGDAPERWRLGTVSLNLDFIASPHIGEWIEATVTMDKSHGRLRFSTCVLRGAGQRLLVRATGVFSALEVAQP